MYSMHTTFVLDLQSVYAKKLCTNVHVHQNFATSVRYAIDIIEITLWPMLHIVFSDFYVCSWR